MTKNKSIPAIFISILVLFLSAVSPVYATIPPDVVGTGYQESVNGLVELGIVAGTPDGTYKPENKITRAEAAKIAAKMLGLESAALASKTASGFADVRTGFWATGYINVSSEKGLIKGNNGLFRPNDNISYAEVLTILVRALGYEQALDKSLKWPDNYLIKAFDLGIVGDVRWTNAGDPATRGNVAKLCWNAMTAEYLPTGSTLIEEFYPDVASNYIKEKTVEQIAKLKDAVVLITTYDSDSRKNEVGWGSGVVVGDGVIVTNSHVLGSSPRFGIAYDRANHSSGEYYTSTVYYKNPEKDIALTDSPDPEVKPVKLGNSDNLKVGQKVVAIGNPLGLQNTVTQGIISAIREEDGQKYIQFDASVTFGSSGGALFDMYGNLIGITSATAEPGENLNFAIPINDVKSVLSNEDTAECNYTLNKQLTEAMEDFAFGNKHYKFSNSSFYNSFSDVYYVNYYICDEAEGAALFPSSFSSADFNAGFLKQLETVHPMLEANGYANYIVNVYSSGSTASSGKVYSYKVAGGVRTVIRDTYASPVAARKSYDEIKTNLNNGIKTLSAGTKSIKYDFALVNELSTNTNAIWVALCMIENTYLNYEETLLDPANSEEIAKSMAEIAKAVSLQYPEKQVFVTITFSHIFDSYPEEYDIDGFEILDYEGQYLVIGVINEVYDVIGDDYNYIWYY